MKEGGTFGVPPSFGLLLGCQNLKLVFDFGLGVG